jgi:hypothetical protein
MADDGREPLDSRIESAAREGLTGTTPANIYRPLRDAEQVTIAPDGRPMDEQPAWRTDFPIDWPQDHYVERRDFMKFMVLTSLAFTVGQFWIAAQNWWRRRRGEPEAVRLISITDLPVGATRTIHACSSARATGRSWPTARSAPTCPVPCCRASRSA